MSEPSGPSPYRWPIVALAFLMNFVTGGWIFLALPFFLPAMETDLGISTGAAQFLFGAIPLAMIVSYFLGGVAGLHFKLRDVVTVGGALLGLSALLRGAFPTYAVGIGASLMAGAGIGLAVPCYISALSKWFPSDELGLANGLRLAGVVAGAAAGQGLVGPFLLRTVGSWETTQMVIGTVAILTTLLWFFTYRDPPSGTVDEADGGPEPVVLKTDVISLLKHAFSVTDMVLLAAIMFMVYFSGQGFLGLFPTWLNAMPFIEDGAVGFYSSLVFLFSLTGMIVIPTWSDRVGRRKPFLHLTIALALAGAIVVALASSPLTIVLASLLGGFGGGAIFPIILSIPGEHPDIGPEFSGMAVGFIYSLGQIGGTIGPTLTGIAYDYGAIPLSVAVVGVSRLLTFPLVFPLGETGGRTD